MRLSVRVVLLACALGLAGAPGAAADEQPLTDEQAADLALAAHAKGDAQALKTLAKGDTPETWVVVWRLCYRKEFAAALALAKAAEGPINEALPAYVEKRKSQPGDDPAAAAFLKAVKAMEAEQHQAALEALPPSVTTTDGALAGRMATTRGRAFLALDRIPEAIAAYEEGARRAESVGWIARAAWLYSEAGYFAYQRGDQSTAARAWAKHLTLEERVGNPKHLTSAQFNNGVILREAGQLDAALAITEKAIANARAGKFPDLLVMALSNQGQTTLELGMPARALALNQEALQGALALGNHALASKAHSNLAWVHVNLGDFAKARAAGEAALASAKEARDGDAAAAGLMALGRVDAEMGLGDRAVPEFEQAAKLYEQTGNAPGQASALYNVASVHLGHDRPVEAEAALRRSLEVAGQSDDAHRKMLITQHLVVIQGQRGRFEEMLRLAEAGLADPDAAREGEATLRLRMYVGLAQSLLQRHDAAIATLRAVERDVSMLDVGPLRLSVSEALALALLDAGQFADAMSVARAAIERGALAARALSDEESAGMRNRRRGGPAVGATAAANLGNAAQALWFLESGRAGALLEALGGRKVVGAGTLPPALLEQERLARAAETRATAKRRVAERAKDAAGVKAAQAEATEAHTALTKAVEAIQRQEKSAAAILYPKVRDVAALRALLSPADALVFYGVFVDSSMALVIEPKGERVLVLGPPKPIVAAAEALRQAAAKGSETLQAEVDALVKLVVEPLKLGPGVKRVVISPDGPLVYTPWNLLLGDREVALVPSGTTWAELREPAKTTPGDGVLALGDPDYGQSRPGSAGRTIFGEGDLVPLPGTREEAKKVGQVVLLGAEATEAGLRKAVAARKRWRAVHFACHGLVDPERPARSALALTPDGEDDGFLSGLEVTRLRVPADLVVLSACETGRGKVVRGEGLMGLSRAFMLAGAPRVLVSLWKVDDRATLLLMERFYMHWKPGTPAAHALALAQKDVREHTAEVVDPVQSRAQGRDVRVKKQPYAAPAFWAGWVVWGLPD